MVKVSSVCINTLLSLLTISFNLSPVVLAQPIQYVSSKQLQAQLPTQTQPTRLIIIIFTGFASQTLNQTTGMQRFLATLGQERKLSQSNLIIERRIFAWDEGSQARRYLEELGKFNNDKLIVIGHSYGGDTAIDFANELRNKNRQVNLLVQIDSVGRSDDVLPVNAISGINYYQRVETPKGEPIVRRSRNIDVNVAFREQLIRENSYPLNHNNIDDSQVIHQAIIQEILSLVSVPTATPQASCQATVDKVLQEIRSKGVRRVEFSIFKGAAIYYTGNPTNRTNKLDIVMIDDIGTPTNNGVSISNIMASPKLLNNWSNQIVKNCGNTAIVSFAISQSDIAISFFIQADGRTKKEKCFLEPNWDISQAQSWGISAIPGSVPD